MMPMPKNMPAISDRDHAECMLAAMHIGLMSPLQFMSMMVDWPRAHYRQNDAGKWRFVGESPAGIRMVFSGTQEQQPADSLGESQ